MSDSFRSHIVSRARSRFASLRASTVSAISGVPLDAEGYKLASAKIAQADRLVKRLNERKRQYNGRDNTLSCEFGSGGHTPEGHSYVPFDSYHPCICQRCYDGARTGVAKIDGYLDTLGWPSDWYRTLYHNPFTESEEFNLDLARKIKWRIEANCLAAIHYSDETSDLLDGGRAVYTSLDPEKQAENVARSEDDAYDAAHPWEVRARREYKGADADADDVLTHQRESNDTETKGGTVQLSFDPTLTSPAERKALRNVRRESANDPTPFEKQAFANKRRIRAKNEQARRDLWMLVRQQDDDFQKLLIESIRDDRKRGRSYVDIRKDVRKSVRFYTPVIA